MIAHEKERSYFWNMNLLRSFGFALVMVSSAVSAPAFDLGIFHARDPLAQRDEWGLLHQSREINEPDREQRENRRFFYYFKANETVVKDPAYVGALQVALRRTGYYCGPIDGVFSVEVTDAIARLQKNHSMRVTGRVTTSVRRALNLP